MDETRRFLLALMLLPTKNMNVSWPMAYEYDDFCFSTIVRFSFTLVCMTISNLNKKINFKLWKLYGSPNLSRQCFSKCFERKNLKKCIVYLPVNIFVMSAEHGQPWKWIRSSLSPKSVFVVHERRKLIGMDRISP